MEDYRRRDVNENNCYSTGVSQLKRDLQAHSFQDVTFGEKKKNNKVTCGQSYVESTINI